MDEQAFRENLVELLNGGHAHLTLDDALRGLTPRLRGVRPDGLPHSVWEELEHMRIAQEDILRFTLDPSWKSPDFPGGYWPSEGAELTDEKWLATVDGFGSDLGEFVDLARDQLRDLTAQIPHGEGQTYLREILLAADHNAYHLGQIVAIRRMLGDWGR
jgi:uncharacterized damage-inducible protein DinB